MREIFIPCLGLLFVLVSVWCVNYVADRIERRRRKKP